MSKNSEAAAHVPPPPVPELQRLFPITRIGNGIRFLVDSKPEERAALALRMGVPAIHSLTCSFELRRDVGDAIESRGRLEARVTQICVVSLEAFDSTITEEFSVRFVPAGTESDDLDLEAEDEIGYEGDILDLGEATSEQLALALDPFPKKPGAELTPDASAEQTGAFAALAKLLPPA